jgi:hypothetical protein
MKRHLLLPAALLLSSPAWAGDFGQHLLACQTGKKFTSVEIGDSFVNQQGKPITQAGKIGLRWANSSKIEWATPEMTPAGTRLAYAGRKPLVFKQFRKPVDDTDALTPYITLQEEGGVKYQCGAEAG